MLLGILRQHTISKENTYLRRPHLSCQDPLQPSLEAKEEIYRATLLNFTMIRIIGHEVPSRDSMG